MTATRPYTVQEAREEPGPEGGSREDVKSKDQNGPGDGRSTWGCDS